MCHISSHATTGGVASFFSSTRAEEPLSGLPRIDYSAGTLRDACGTLSGR